MESQSCTRLIPQPDPDTIQLRILVKFPEGKCPSDFEATDLLAWLLSAIKVRYGDVVPNGVVLADDMRKIGNAIYQGESLAISTVGVDWTAPIPVIAVARPKDMPLDQEALDAATQEALQRIWTEGLEAALRERGYEPVIQMGEVGYRLSFNGEVAVDHIIQECMRQVAEVMGLKPPR